MERALAGVAITACMLVGSGCAAITASRTDSLNVASSPPGAEIRVNGVPVGRTPMAVPIARKTPETVEVVALGYEGQRCSTAMTPGGGYIAGDVLLCVFLFPFGCISWIDAAGYWNTLLYPSCYVTLPPSPLPPLPVPPSPPPASPALAPPPPLAAPPGLGDLAWPQEEQLRYLKACVDGLSARVGDRTRDLCSCAVDELQRRYPRTSTGITDGNAREARVRCAQQMGIQVELVQ
jgi:hypothetical protein